jgi:hypothetical protein
LVMTAAPVPPPLIRYSAMARHVPSARHDTDRSVREALGPVAALAGARVTRCARAHVPPDSATDMGSKDPPPVRYEPTHDA